MRILQHFCSVPGFDSDCFVQWVLLYVVRVYHLSKSGCVVRLWVRYVIANVLGSRGQHHRLCVIRLADVGFLYVLYVKDETFLAIAVWRNLMWVLCFFIVNCNMG